MLYGEPRMTHDIDLIVDLHTEHIPVLLNTFPKSEYYRPPEEVIGVEIARAQRGHFNIIHHATGYKADVYLYGNDKLHEWGMKNRQFVEIGNDKIGIAPAEYVIVRKLEYYRESGFQKHVLDIESMFRIKRKQISLAILEDWIKNKSLEKEWALIQKEQ
jgi:serine/threonine protein kinase